MMAECTSQTVLPSPGGVQAYSPPQGAPQTGQSPQEDHNPQSLELVLKTRARSFPGYTNQSVSQCGNTLPSRLPGAALPRPSDNRALRLLDSINSSLKSKFCSKRKGPKTCDANQNLLPQLKLFSILTSDYSLLTKTNLSPNHVSSFLTAAHTENEGQRQWDLYELIGSERSHCKAIIDMVDHVPNPLLQEILGEEPNICFYIKFIFERHYSLLAGLSALQGTGNYIGDVGSILAEHFTDDNVSVSYCKVFFYCQYLTRKMKAPVPACIQLVPLRLTRIRIQLEALIKHSEGQEQEELRLVNKALDDLKIILTNINEYVGVMERRRRLVEIYDNTNSKSILFAKSKSIDKDCLLLNNLLHHEEKATIQINRKKQLPVIVLVLNDCVCLLETTSKGKFNLYCNSELDDLFYLDQMMVQECEGTVHGINITMLHAPHVPVVLNTASHSQQSALLSALCCRTLTSEQFREALSAQQKKRASTLEGGETRKMMSGEGGNFLRLRNFRASYRNGSRLVAT